MKMVTASSLVVVVMVALAGLAGGAVFGPSAANARSGTGGNARAAALAGALSGGDVSFVYVDGGTDAGDAGGLIGGILVGGGTVKSSWSSSAVSANTANTSAGGLVALVGGGSIADSYATGAVTHTGSGGRAGGLVGIILGANITIDDSYATGAVSGAASGGLVGANSGGTATTSYWDTATTGQTTSAIGTAKTTSELTTPTSNTGIYADWGTDKWDFREATKYPLLKADFDGDGTATWQEFGDQDPAPAFAAAASIDQVLVAKDVSYTSANALPKATGGNLPMRWTQRIRQVAKIVNCS